MSKAKVGILMGSKTDLMIMEKATEILKKFGVEYEMRILSAHRTPDETAEFVNSAAEKNIKVFIAGAGGAAHLPGVVAGSTTLPVIGVPINSSLSYNGLDSLLSIVQMPSGVPVASVAIDGSKNAAILAVQILATADAQLASQLKDFKKEQASKVLADDASIQG